MGLKQKQAGLVRGTESHCGQRLTKKGDSGGKLIPTGCITTSFIFIIIIMKIIMITITFIERQTFWAQFVLSKREI